MHNLSVMPTVVVTHVMLFYLHFFSHFVEMKNKRNNNFFSTNKRIVYKNKLFC